MLAMPTFCCTVCREDKCGESKVLRRNSPFWEFHDMTRPPGAPPLEDGGKMCPRCYQEVYNHVILPERMIDTPAPAPNPVPDPVFGEVIVRTVGKTRRICSVCGRHDMPMQTVGELVSAFTWVGEEIFIPPQNKVCKLHVQHQRLTPQALESLATRSKERPMSEKELLTNMKLLLSNVVHCIPTVSKPVLDFESPDLTDKEYLCYTGLSKLQFDDLLSYLSGRIHDSANRTKRNALGIFLCKLRMNNSQDALGCLFGMDQPRISDVFHQVAEALHSNFVPQNLGYDHITREAFIRDHSRTLASVLFDQQPGSCMLILDGTYLEIEKSSNFQIQHDTYSGHKHYNLVKPMFVTGLDGYIFGAEGLFLGNNNDASILSNMLSPGSEFANFVHEEDVLILDRGFRDNKTELEEAGIRMAMPNLLAKGKRQFTDLEANESRLVTMVRWVIEAVNGRLKNKYKFLRDRISNSYLDKGFLMKIVKIACALLNKYSPPIAPDKEGDLERAKVIKEKAEISNLLQDLIVDRGWLTSRANYVSLDMEQLDNFPRLTMEHLSEISLGIYQIRMAKSYSALHIEEGEYAFHIHRELPDLIRVKMESRFRRGTVHTVWVHYLPHGRGPGSIRGYYCMCQSGARTLGCCSHVMSVVWYFGVGRHDEHLKFPAENIAANLFDVRTHRG